MDHFTEQIHFGLMVHESRRSSTVKQDEGFSEMLPPRFIESTLINRRTCLNRNKSSHSSRLVIEPEEVNATHCFE